MSAKQAQKNSASEKLFHNYIRFIQGEVIGHDKIGYSYAISENIRNKWRYDFRWDKEIENFIILQTKTYIRTLDSRDAKSTDPNTKGKARAELRPARRQARLPHSRSLLLPGRER